MEIGAPSSAVYLPPQLTQPAEPRVARYVTREISGTQDNAATINQGRKGPGNQSAALPSNAGILDATQANKTPENRAADNARAVRESQPADQTGEARRGQQQEVDIAAAGSIKLDVEDGDRVLKVFDSKDVLIYQLPPKGALMLIKAQEHAQQSQVQTSA